MALFVGVWNAFIAFPLFPMGDITSVFISKVENQEGTENVQPSQHDFYGFVYKTVEQWYCLNFCFLDQVCVIKSLNHVIPHTQKKLLNAI